jgi:hypothetical protein|tara:strand:+ start:1203 stop:1499 length:297 start_codon:yes stop_codon:yes gene_type:complete
MPARLNDSSEVTIPVRNLIALIAATAVAVMGYFRVGERLSVLERDAELSNVQIEANSEFRVLWPRGELGSLPDDAEQNMRLDFIDAELSELRSNLDER